MTTQIVIAELDEVVEQIEEAKEVANFLPDVSTDEGYEKSKRVSLDIGKMLTALENTRKEKKKYFLDGGRQVDKQAEALREQLEDAQLPHKEAYKKLDTEKKEREAKRKSDIESRIDDMEALPDLLDGEPSEKIKESLDKLKADPCKGFEEYELRAETVKKESVQKLEALFTKTKKAEEDAAELARLKAADEKRRLEARDEEIRKEASAKAEAAEKKAKAEKAAAEKARKKAEEDRVAAEKKAEEDAEKHAAEKKAAEEKAEKDRIAAEKQAKKDAEAAAENARKEEIARQEAIKQQEIEAAAKREANKKHIGKIRGEAKDGLMALGLDETKAKEIVMAIHSGKIKNVTIKY